MADIDILTELIEMTIDSADSYEQAAVAAPRPELAQMFRRLAAERRSIVADLRAQIVALGGMPADDDSVLAGAHRAFCNLRARLLDDPQDALGAVERGEARIMARYDETLRGGLDPAVRRTVEAGLATIRADRQRLDAMKLARQPAMSRG